jgi:hypothetical protein
MENPAGGSDITTAVGRHTCRRDQVLNELGVVRFTVWFMPKYVSKCGLTIVMLLIVVLSACATEPPTSVPVSKDDHTTQWWGDKKNYGPKVHYVHALRDANGQIKETYRYYLDSKNKPVLDGDRYIRRWEHDPGLIIEYKDGHVVRKYRVIVTGWLIGRVMTSVYPLISIFDGS